MYRDILVPLDGSRASEYAIPAAQEIARRSGGRVTLFRAIHGPALPIPLPLSVRRKLDRLVRRHMKEVALRWRAADAPTDTLIQRGNPVDAILRVAAGYDLIVMTTHGAGGLRRWVTGSVAERVIRLAKSPVLAIHPPASSTRARARAAAMHLFNDILVPLDSSLIASRALTEIRQLAGDSARVHLLRVVSKEATRNQRDMSEIDLSEAAFRLETRGVEVSQNVVTDEHPAEAIVRFAEQKRCGLIAMTTHGEGGVRRWLVGSTTDRTIHLGPVPVLVTRTPAKARAWKALGRTVIAV